MTRTGDREIGVISGRVGMYASPPQEFPMTLRWGGMGGGGGMAIFWNHKIIE